MPEEKTIAPRILRESKYELIYIAPKVEKSMVEDLGPEVVKCRNLRGKEKGRYLAEVRLMSKGKWARRS